MKSFKFALALTALFTNWAIESVHIVTVKTETIIKESKRGNKIQDKVKKEQEKLSAPFAELEEKIKKQETRLVEKQRMLAKEDEDFKNQASLLSTEARAEKYEELQKKHRDLEEEVADFQRSMRKAHEDAKKVDQKLEAFYRKEMMAFEQEIKATIESLAKTHNWDLVLAKEAVIFASDATDKTSAVIAKLDEKEDKAAQASTSKK